MYDRVEENFFISSVFTNRQNPEWRSIFTFIIKGLFILAFIFIPAWIFATCTIVRLSITSWIWILLFSVVLFLYSVIISQSSKNTGFIFLIINEQVLFSTGYSISYEEINFTPRRSCDLL